MINPLIAAGANRQRDVPGAGRLPPERVSQGLAEDLALVDGSPFGGAPAPRFLESLFGGEASAMPPGLGSLVADIH